MHQTAPRKPYYPLKEVKEKIRCGHFDINQNALDDARDIFNWGPEKIKQCLLKLNDRDYAIDINKNHFFKKEPHRHIPHTMMDYYKAKNIMDGESVYTHFYIRQNDGKVVISSFHELD
ncbi:type II toxin-antitoxin system MqsR family toxin [Desulforegula conservatrix]|uniref:type II toxin-antitoxin system MqsR family toxin n=1 Tax=Desulforegula conservatrix TaxID=153026 RepID=UPI000483C160|nr:type II toxin-antitoxin system MqsR family toxin [Desulforegula conservatrix]